jgi:hypothetical protein
LSEIHPGPNAFVDDLNRGDFALASAGMAGAAVTGFAWSPRSCQPTGLSPSRGKSATTKRAAGGGRNYSTTFDLIEYPISEGGAWNNTGQLWTKVQTDQGMAFGTNGSTNSYDDSYAYLSGFGPDQPAEAVVYVSSKLTGSPHEVEMLLRWDDSAQSARGYECLFNFEGGVEIVRWNGLFGDFTVPPSKGPGTIGRRLVTGDTVKGRIIGNDIALYINGVPVYTATDSTWTAGQPGIGFFKRIIGLNSDLQL